MSGWFSNGGAGGGGTAIDAYANQQTLMHRLWLTGSALAPTISESTTPAPTSMDVNTEMNAASTYGGGVSPYALASAYDPDTDLVAIEARIEEFVADVEGLDPGADLGEALAFALDQLNTEVITDADVSNLVDAFETRQSGAYARSATRLAAGMFDIGATMSSAFTMGLANLENDRLAEQNNYDLKLRAEMKNQRIQVGLQLQQQYIQAKNQKIAYRQSVAAMQDALSRLAITAKNDETGFDLQMAIKDRQWNLDLFTFGNNVMSSIAGSATVPHPTQWERKLDAATSLASTIQSGAQLGNNFISALRGNNNAGFSNFIGLLSAAASF
jgi:hypothetical protein